MPSPVPKLNEEERAALARARASMALEGYPTTDEQAAAAVAVVQDNDLVENGHYGQWPLPSQKAHGARVAHGKKARRKKPVFSESPMLHLTTINLVQLNDDSPPGRARLWLHT